MALGEYTPTVPIQGQRCRHSHGCGRGVVTDAFRDRLPNDVIDILSRISLDVNAVTAMD